MSRAAIYSGNSASDGNEIRGFKVFEVNVSKQSRVIGAPVETGHITFDNKVIDPMKITVVGTVVGDGSEDSVFRALEKMFNNRSYEFYAVCDGSNTYTDMILQSCPIKRNSEKFDFYNFELQYIQAMLVQSSIEVSVTSDNSDVYESGENVGEDMPYDEI